MRSCTHVYVGTYIQVFSFYFCFPLAGPTLKLKRMFVQRKYAEQIDAMYDEVAQ